MARTTRTLGAALTAVTLLLTLSPGVAHANVPSGTRTVYKGPSPGRGVMSWRVAPIPPEVSLVAITGTLAVNHCVDAWFDWTRQDIGNDHYDARVVRNCRVHIVHNYAWQEPSFIGLAGMQKAATCYSILNSPLTAAKCTNAQGFTNHVAGAVNPILPNTCTSASLRRANNTIVVYSGGNPQSCTS